MDGAQGSTRLSQRRVERVEITRELLDLLNARRIYHRTYDGERWQVGQILGVHPDARLEPYSHILEGHRVPAAFGAFSYSHSMLDYFVRVGRYCSIARDVSWMGPNHPTTWATTSTFPFDDGALQGVRAYRDARPEGKANLRPWAPRDATVIVGNDVWIGEGAMIAPGITIGDGAIVGARSLVLKDVPPFMIVGGTPAKTMRPRFDENTAKRFAAAAWWRYAPATLQALPLEEPERFVDALEKLIAKDPPPPMSPIPVTLADMLAA